MLVVRRPIDGRSPDPGDHLDVLGELAGFAETPTGAFGDLLGEDRAHEVVDAAVEHLQPLFVAVFHPPGLDVLNVIELKESIQVSLAAGMRRNEDGLHYSPPRANTVKSLVANTALESVPTVGAFRNLAAGRLGTPKEGLDWAVPVVADDDEARARVTVLVDKIEVLRPLDAGGISDASEVEAVTPILINIASSNSGMHDLGVQFR